MRLGFDIDEVVVRLADLLANYVEEKYNIEWPVDCFKFFELTKCVFHKDPEINKEMATHLLEVVNSNEFQLQAPPYEEAAYALRGFKKQGHTLHYITNRPVANKEATITWFRENKIPFDSIDVIGKFEKGMVGRALNLDFYMDDLESCLESMYIHKHRWRKGLALMTRPWNKESIDGSRFIRMNDWAEVERHLGIHKR